jgi:hypothetical protein
MGTLVGAGSRLRQQRLAATVIRAERAGVPSGMTLPRAPFTGQNEKRTHLWT